MIVQDCSFVVTYTFRNRMPVDLTEAYSTGISEGAGVVLLLKQNNSLEKYNTPKVLLKQKNSLEN